MTVSVKDIKVTIPIFYCKKKDEFIKWWNQFDAYATQKGFDEVCQRTRKGKQKKFAELPKTQVEYEADGETKKVLAHTDEEKTAIIMNKMAITATKMAFVKSTDCTAYITASKSENWPNGEIHLVIQELFDEYAPADITKNVETVRVGRRHLGCGTKSYNKE